MAPSEVARMRRPHSLLFPSRVWVCLLQKHKYFEDLSSKETHKLFKDFVAKWNAGELSEVRGSSCL